MEKTLRKCGVSSGVSSHLSNVDINSLPFVIPKCYQIKSNKLPELDYHLDIHRFNYTFKTENAILSNKRQREAAEQAAAEQAAAELATAEREAAEREAAAAEQADAEQAATELAAKTEVVVPNGTGDEAGEADSDDCDLIQNTHPTNPFLAMSGEVLIPTLVAGVKPKQSDVLSTDHDIISTFDVQNSNPFDGAELQSLSNFDALKSVLAPEHPHDFSLWDKSVSPQSTGDCVYTEVVRVAPTGADIPATNSAPPDPLYTTVTKKHSSPAVIKSMKLDDKNSNIQISNGPQIHKSFSAVSTMSGFEVPPTYSPPPPTKQRAPVKQQTSNKIQPPVTPPARVTPPPPVTPPVTPPAPPLSCSPFPKIPEDVVARAMQRLQHNQEKCFDFLKEVLEVMGQHDCSAEVAESVLIELSGSERAHEETILLIKQFSELGFPVQNIVKGLKQKPVDRDALLDLLVINA